MNFLELLLEKHRMPLIYRIRRDFDVLYREERKLLPVQVTSAVALDAELVKSLGERIGQATGREVELTAEVQPDLIGGVGVGGGNPVPPPPTPQKTEQNPRPVAPGERRG